MQRKIRVLVGKPGLDGHDRGAKVVAAALRDAGMEVIYTGLHQSPEQIVEAAVQEDVDVVALSILSGAHMTLFPEVLELMRRRGIGDRLLTGGGIIPQDDMDALAGMGVGRLFGPGTSTQDIAVYIREWFDIEHGEPHDVALQAPASRAAPRPAPKRAATSVPKRVVTSVAKPAKTSAPKRAKTSAPERAKTSAPKRAKTAPKRAKVGATKRAKSRRPAASPRKTAGRSRPKRSAPKRARARRSRS